jgi:predicted Zn-dependent protease
LPDVGIEADAATYDDTKECPQYVIHQIKYDRIRQNKGIKERIGRTMMRDRLAEAIQLREEGRAKQDRAILKEARTLLLDLVAAYPDDAEINFQTAVAHDNSGLGREAIPFYVRALEQGLSGPDLERALLGLGSTYRALGYYQQAEETLRRGVREFPHNRALQVFLAMALYNTQGYKEAIELLLTNLMETTSDEKLQYFKRPVMYYAPRLDESW